MPITAEENRLLTEVEGDAPMGVLMRENYWIPFARAAGFKAGGPPQRITVLGKDYAVFRAQDGRVGFFDEACPHRGVSLVLARNEGCAIRCIFHGWKIDVSGKLLEAPSQPFGAEEFAAGVKIRAYPVREAGQLLWVWLGEAAEPAFPNLPFFGLPEENLWMTQSFSDCNWLQGVEATIDSVHIGNLHRSWLQVRSQVVGGNSSLALADTLPPRYEVEPAKYGMRAAALRQMSDGGDYLRVTEYFMPFVSLVPASQNSEGVIFITMPISNSRHKVFFGRWADDRPMEPEDGGTIGTGNFDPDNYAPLAGGRAANWGQDRAAMDNGHFSGFVKNLLEEDIVVQVSMGPVVDRTKEQLSAGDVAIVRARRMLLQAIDDFKTGILPPGSALAGDPEVRRPIDTIVPPGQSWRDSAEALLAAE